MGVLTQIKKEWLWRNNHILKNAQELREDLVISFDVALVLANQIYNEGNDHSQKESQCDLLPQTI